MNDLQDLLYRVLLAVPQANHIPYFAMGAEAVRPDYEITEVSTPAVNFNGNLLRSLPGRFGPFGFLSIRHRRSERTATYSSWLGFASREMAESFVASVKHQRHGLNAMIDRTNRELADARTTFEANLAGGLFDLGYLEKDRRRKQADLYVRLDDEVTNLGRQAAGLRRFSESPFGEHAGVCVG